jgi:hypothetical protein
MPILTNTEIPYPAELEDNWYDEWETFITEMDRMAAIAKLGVFPVERPSTTLFVRVTPGTFISSSGAAIDYAGSASFAVAASSTLRIWLDDAGTLTSGASWPTTPHVRLATVVTGTTSVTTVTDERRPPTVNRPGVGLAFVATAPITVSNTVTESTLFGTGVGSLSLPANFWAPGRVLRVRIKGVFSTTGTPNVTLRGKLGATTIVSSGAVATVGTIANLAWTLELELMCRSAGVTGTIIGQGMFRYSGQAPIGLPATASITIDTTAASAINATIEWGTASGSNTITAHIGTVEVLG